MGAVARSGRIGDELAWELSFESAEPPLFHLPRDWMYRAPLPRTKLLSRRRRRASTARLTVDGREITVDGWRGMAGHNWGAQHAERWIWLHGLTADGDWLDAAIGRVKVGPLTTPWIGNGALSLAGDRFALRRGAGHGGPGPLHFTLPGAGCSVRGSVSAPLERFVGWVYADPDGSEHHTLNCSIADMRLSVSRGGASGVGAGGRGRCGLRARHARARPRGADPAVRRRLRALQGASRCARQAPPARS